LNDEGTLSAKFFRRQGDVQEILADQLDGSTQGAGISYEVDFDNFKELWRKIFKKNEASENKPTKATTQPISVMGNDSLIRFYTKGKNKP